jgi:hypothetical protein
MDPEEHVLFLKPYRVCRTVTVERVEQSLLGNHAEIDGVVYVHGETVSSEIFLVFTKIDLLADGMCGELMETTTPRSGLSSVQTL